MSVKLKPGRVLSFRLNPRDCISCVDVADAMELDTTRMSFDQVARIALSSLLESVRQNKVIPNRAGFEFKELVADRFKGTGKQGRLDRLRITAIADKLGPNHITQPLVPESKELRSARIRFSELEYKLSRDPLNATQAEKDELQVLAQQGAGEPE